MKEKKSGKAPGVDGFVIHRIARMAVLEWLVRLLNISFDMGVVPMDWRSAKGRVTNDMLIYYYYY